MSSVCTSTLGIGFRHKAPESRVINLKIDIITAVTYTLNPHKSIKETNIENNSKRMIHLSLFDTKYTF